MTTLVFLACVAAIILLVQAIESDRPLQQRLADRPAGLMTWITGGNWPAKIGAALMIVGTGALIRYALLNIEVPPNVKLAGGLLISLALGATASFVPAAAARRTLSLSLGGAAFGVAYLTAYSAFALFGYFPTPTGLALLTLVSVATGVYSLTRGAMSLAILAMAGAYLAPAFAITDPGPLVVYGYYVGAACMTFMLVAVRGWRPLIHLGFLFTLAGGAFFGWTAGYFSPAHADVMLPMLLILSALQVAMPIVEQRGSAQQWARRLDIGYMVALPVVAALLAWSIAPDSAALAASLSWLAAIWSAAAAGARLLNRPIALAHVVIAVLLLVLAAASWFGELPWELLGLAASAAALALAAWRQPDNARLLNIATGMVLLFGTLHILGSLSAVESTRPFANGVFAERLAGALLLITAGAICRRRRQALDSLLLAIGTVWLVIAVGTDLVRFKLAALPLVAHWILILLAASVWIPGRKLRIADSRPGLLTALLVLSGWWAAADTGGLTALVTAAAGVAVLLATVWYQNTADDAPPAGSVLPALGVAVLAAAWGWFMFVLPGSGGLYVCLSLGVLVGCAALLTAHFSAPAHARPMDELTDGFSIGFGAVVAGSTLAYISRNPWAITLEIVCLGAIALTTWLRRARGRDVTPGIITAVIASALVLQANLLRWLGPPGELSVADILRLRWPAVVSLLWAVLACVMTVWSRRIGSRMLWVAGGTLLAASAVKLLVIDFHALGQLANILAMMAAGGVFLLVGWIAPMPPAKPKVDKPAAGRASPAKSGNGLRTMLVVGGLILLLASPEATLLLRELRHTARPSPTPAAAPAPAATIQGDAVATPAPPQPALQAEQASPQPAAAPAVDEAAPGEDVDIATIQAVTPVRPPPAYMPPRVRPPPRSPGPGDAGLDRLLREGSIRRATARDLQDWARSQPPGAPVESYLHMDPRSGNQYIWRGYVVLREMTYPSELYGAHRAIFIVPRGVPRPYGDAGHSSVLEYAP
jgi:uncharacterized membrane protein